MGDVWWKCYSSELLLDRKVGKLPLDMQAVLFRLWCLHNLDWCIPDDIEDVAIRTRIPMDTLKSFWDAHMGTFFQHTDEGWVSPRMVAEKESSQKKTKAAVDGWNKSRSRRSVQQNADAQSTCIKQVHNADASSNCLEQVHDAYSASDSASDSASYSDSVSSFNKKSEATEADSFDGQMWLLRIAACYPNDSNSGGSPAESMAFIGAIEQESKRQGFKSPNDAARYLLERVALHAKAFASYPQADRKYIPNLSTFLDPEQRRYFRDPKERGSNGSSKAEQNEQQSRDAIANAARRFVERRQAAGAADVLGAEPVQQNNY